MADLYKTPNYRDYLNSRLGSKGTRTGQKKRASEAIGVHTSLLSQVLSGRVDLSLEQAERMNRFLGHSDEESEYFLLLVLKDRAGSKDLKERFERRLAQERGRRLVLHERVRKESTISDEDQERFYSSYTHAAIHVLVSIGRYKTRSQLATALGLPLPTVSEAVSFLVQIGVIREAQGKLEPGSSHIHLDATSKMIHRHHLNWRLRCIDRIYQTSKEDLHYSAVVSLSEADVERIKESLLQNLSRNAAIIGRSKEETAFVYCFDFFRLPLDQGAGA